MWHSAVSQILPGSGDYASCFISVVKPELQDNGYLTCLAIQLTYLLFLNESILEMSTKAPRLISAELLCLRKSSSRMPLLSCPHLKLRDWAGVVWGTPVCRGHLWPQILSKEKATSAWRGSGPHWRGFTGALVSKPGWILLSPPSPSFPIPSFSGRHLPNHDLSPPMLR